jgi:polysaccharide export outer membrane protein
MRKLRVRTLGWLFLLIAAIAPLQAFGQYIESTPYRLRPLDEISIQVYNEAQINAVLPILPDGRISAPFVGLIEVAGKTTTQVEAELVDLYRERLKLRDPKVSVVVLRYRPVRGSVVGMVLQPGKFEDFKPGDTVLTLLSRAGGISPDRADLRHATLIRAGSSEAIPIDLHAMLFKNDLTQNYVLEDGDTLNVPEDVVNRVTVIGSIAQPGAYPYKEPMYLSDLIAAARGPIPQRSKFSEIMILRRKPGVDDQILRIRANYVNYIRKGDISQNVLMMPGDTVFIPETKTPDYNQLGALLNSLFLVDRFLTGGLFGFRLFGN